MFKYHTSSFLFSHTCFWLRQLEIFDTCIWKNCCNLGLQSDCFFLKLGTPILLYMDCNHAQKQGKKISVNPIEGLSIQPVKWWSPWEPQLINKGALCLMHPITGWLPIYMRAKQMKALERNERITLRYVTRISYHWFRSVLLHDISSKLIYTTEILRGESRILKKNFKVWIFYEIGDGHNFGEIGPST